MLNKPTSSKRTVTKRSGRAAALLVASITLAAACSSDSSSSSTTTTGAPTTDAATTTTTVTSTAPSTTTATPPTDTTIDPSLYRADITRTEYGIPHIVADDWGSLGFGQGYAFAQDRACTLIDQVIKVRGERAAWFGPGDDDEYVNSDFAYRHLGLHDDADERFANQPEQIAEMVAGYVAGFNAELDEEGPHGWCEGEPWVQPITTTDLYAYLNDVVLFASSQVLLPPIATATPPAAASDDADGAADDTAITSSADAATDDAVVLPEMRTDLASNGWAIGSELSDTGGGLLLANPHFPWEGERRLWESQLTLTTGELNVYGATLSGVPGVLIGFNDAVAWTHTVSAGYRMTLYELTLTPDDPTSYVYGDDAEAMTPTDITIEVLGDDGSTDEVTRTMWSSHYGPMLNLPFGWSTEKAYTYRDANLDNADILGQFFGMNQATSMDEFIEAHREFNGIPWVNTMATSADGQAWYADTASAPNLSDDTIAEWQAAVDSGALAAVILDNGAILLDGSNPANEWVDDPAATRPGILPFDEQPQLLRDDFIFNANDSHWLANPDELLTGYSPMTGAEEIPQSARTRMNVALLTDPELRGTDGKFSLAEIQAAIFSNRSMHADLLLKQVLDVCENASTPELDNDRGPVDLTDTCDVLRDWDGTYGIDSVGAVLWREFMNRFDNTDMTDAGALYAVGFDPTDPAGTPNTLNADPEPIVQALAEATFGLVEAGFGVDAVLGDLQFDGRTVDEHIPLPGGTWADGTASIVGCCSGSNSTAETGTRGTWSDIYSFSNIGYPVSFGNSFMMTLQFTDDGPVAEALLNYGQPDDPADPDFTAQTKLYSAGEFRPVLFTADDIATDSSATTISVTGRR